MPAVASILVDEEFVMLVELLTLYLNSCCRTVSFPVTKNSFTVFVGAIDTDLLFAGIVIVTPPPDNCVPSLAMSHVFAPPTLSFATTINLSAPVKAQAQATFVVKTLFPVVVVETFAIDFVTVNELFVIKYRSTLLIVQTRAKEPFDNSKKFKKLHPVATAPTAILTFDPTATPAFVYFCATILFPEVGAQAITNPPLYSGVIVIPCVAASETVVEITVGPATVDPAELTTLKE